MHKQSGVVVPSEPDPAVSSPPSVGLGQHRQVVCQGEEGAELGVSAGGGGAGAGGSGGGGSQAHIINGHRFLHTWHS